MLKVSRNKIVLTRGDTAYLRVELTDDNGNAYTPAEGDKVFFRLKKSAVSGSLLLDKEAYTDSMTLELRPEDTARLDFGSYRYEVELVTEAGEHFTVIENAPIEITAELENHDG